MIGVDSWYLDVKAYLVRACPAIVEKPYRFANPNPGRNTINSEPGQTADDENPLLPNVWQESATRKNSLQTLSLSRLRPNAVSLLKIQCHIQGYVPAATLQPLFRVVQRGSMRSYAIGAHK